MNRKVLLAIILISGYLASFILSFFVPMRDPDSVALTAVSVLICILAILLILFPYTFAKLELLFKVRDFENTEPHDFSIAAAKIGGWVMYFIAHGMVLLSALI